MKDVLGGSSTYFAYAASFFTGVNLVAVVGEDFPDEYLDLLRSRKIDLSGLEIKKGKTFRWSGIYGYDLNERETREVHLNVFENFHPKLSPALRKSPYVFLANIDPELHLEVIRQAEKPSLIVCDTMDIWIRTKRRTLEETLSQVDIIVLNESEARELSGEANLIKAGKSILKFGPQSVVIKKGEHGVLYISKKNFFAIPAYPLETVFDPTGAGDSFAGGFLGYLAKEGVNEKNIKYAIAYGAIIASFTVEDFSLERLKRVTNKEIEARFREFKKMTHFGI